MELAERAVAVLAGVVLAACSSAVSPPSPQLAIAWQARLAGAVDGTPAIVGGRVYAASAGGELAAFDAGSGTQVWVRKGLGAISDSPAVDSGRLFAGTLTGHLLAFRAADGSELWNWTAPPHGTLWSSPVVYRGLVVIGIASPYGDQPLVPGRLVGLDAKTGIERWNMCLRQGCGPGDGVWSTPVIDSHGTAFVGAGNPDDGILAFDPATGARKWFAGIYPDNDRDLDIGARPVVFSVNGRELVGVASVEGTFAVLDAAGGALVWSRKLVVGSAVHGLIASPAYDGSRIYVASASPPTGLIALNPEDGQVVWRRATDLPVYSAPALAGDLVVFGTGNVFGSLEAGSVLAVSAAGGTQRSSHDTRSAVRSGPAVAGSLVVVGDSAGDVIAFRLSST